ncbi:Secreted protein [Plasmodiophora brassicae]
MPLWVHLGAIDYPMSLQVAKAALCDVLHGRPTCRCVRHHTAQVAPDDAPACTRADSQQTRYRLNTSCWTLDVARVIELNSRMQHVLLLGYRRVQRVCENALHLEDRTRLASPAVSRPA